MGIRLPEGVILVGWLHRVVDNFWSVDAGSTIVLISIVMPLMLFLLTRHRVTSIFRLRLV